MQALSIFIYLLSVGFAACDSASLVWNEASNSYSYKAGWVPDAMAYGKLVNAINETGWAMFDVTTNGSYSDTMQAYAAGYLEGYLTRDLIRMHWHNTYNGYCSEPYSSYCQRLQDYLVKNFDWMKLQRDQAEGRDPYWHQVGLFLDQLTGMIDGYTAGQEKKHDHLFDVKGLIMLQISGDLEDLSSALGAPPSQQRPLGSGSCSAIIKVLPDNADLYVSHDTWTEYSTMLRILKKYSFNFHVQKGGDELIKGNTVTFSSYPGSLLSGDDFYVISSGLVTQETTIGNSNAALWAKVKPTNSVLECIRNVVANRLAQTGDEWASLFSRHNSGTYNNQWMIVDYKLFKPHSALPDTGLLTVVEQIPGLIVSKDQTAFLRQTSYWPSYNVAYYPEVFNLSGGWDNVKKFGDWFTYDKTPRALIFKRDQSNVVDIPSLIKLMRYNDYTKDPYSRCECTPPYSAENSIAARCDLNPANGTYPFSSLGHRDHGATDMKMTNSTLVTSLQFVGISGPTFDPLPPFQWSTSDYRDTVSHVGHPDLWTFKPVIADWDKKSFRSVY